MNHSISQTKLSLDVWKADDDWTGVTEMEQRKKRQNRLNQRAYRRRNAPKDVSAKPGRGFRVDRFRLVEIPSTRLPKVLPVTDHLEVRRKAIIPEKSALEERLESLAPKWALCAIVSGRADNTVAPNSHLPVPPGYELVAICDNLTILMPPVPVFSIDDQIISQELPKVGQFKKGVDAPISSPSGNVVSTNSPRGHFPLSSDHLLHLIHHNVFRGLITNKVLVASATTQHRKERGEEGIEASFVNLCDGFTVIQPKPGQSLPPALNPTDVQMTIGHSAWFNMFPHPKIRDNLIRYEGKFDPYDFCNDIFGELVGETKTSVPDVCTPVDQTDDIITLGRKGLIIWGEPWDVEGWEVMPGFVKKWGWVLEGCEEVIATSNRWRAKRDEEPLVFL